MPELPEMDNYRRLLTNLVVGKRITHVHIQREKSINVSPGEFISRVVDREVIRIDRKAKQLWFVLDSGDVLLLHLMLGGWMFYGTAEQKPDRTVQVDVSFGQQHLFFIGLRLGYLHIHSWNEVVNIGSALGPEPFDPNFTSEMFIRMLRAKRGVLKPLLVDQKFISGIGNCYSDEICFDAGILPSRTITSLQEEEQMKLYHSIRSVLTEAIHYGGYMESPLYVGDQLTGQYNDRCKVYDGEGQPCVRCGSPIVRQDIAARKSFCCVQCQH